MTVPTIKHVETSLRKWLPLLDLNTWDVKLQITLIHDHGDDDAGCPVMSIVSDWAYRTISITVYQDVLEGQSIDRVDEFVAHELCHALVCPLRDATKATWRNTEEQVVTMLSRAFVRQQEQERTTSLKAQTALAKAALQALDGKPERLRKLCKGLGL